MLHPYFYSTQVQLSISVYSGLTTLFYAFCDICLCLKLFNILVWDFILNKTKIKIKNYYIKI